MKNILLFLGAVIAFVMINNGCTTVENTVQVETTGAIPAGSISVSDSAPVGATVPFKVVFNPSLSPGYIARITVNGHDMAYELAPEPGLNIVEFSGRVRMMNGDIELVILGKHNNVISSNKKSIKIGNPATIPSTEIRASEKYKTRFRNNTLKILFSNEMALNHFIRHIVLKNGNGLVNITTTPYVSKYPFISIKTNPPLTNAAIAMQYGSQTSLASNSMASGSSTPSSNESVMVLSNSQSGNSQQALEYLKGLIKNDPESWTSKNLQRVVDDIQHNRLDSDAADHLAEGVRKGNQGQIHAAIAEFTAAIKLAPKYAPAYNSRAGAYYALGHYNETVADATKAIELEPGYYIAYNTLGTAYDKQNNYSGAISEYDLALKLNPKYSTAYFNRGNAYRDMKQLQKAITDYSNTIKLSPKFAQAYNARGYTYRLIGSYQIAVKDYTEAIRLRPDFLDPYYNRGFLYMTKLGETSKGCEDWKKACELGRCTNYQKAKALHLCP